MTYRPAPWFTIAAVGLAVVASSSMAFAQGLVVPTAQPAAAAEAAPRAAAGDWSNYNARPLTPAAGMLAIHGDLVSNLSTGKGGKPVWITPNFVYGVTDQLGVALLTNPQAEFLPVAGGLCLGSSLYCKHVFNLISPNLLLSLIRNDSTEVVVHGGIDYAFSPSSLFVRGGALFRLGLPASLALMADPTVVVTVTNRGANGEEQLLIPVRLGYQANGQVNVGLVSGVNGPFPHFNDAFVIPLGVGVWLTPNSKLDVGANFTFGNLAGRAGGLDTRSIAVSANYRL